MNPLKKISYTYFPFVIFFEPPEKINLNPLKILIALIDQVRDQNINRGKRHIMYIALLITLVVIAQEHSEVSLFFNLISKLMNVVGGSS